MRDDEIYKDRYIWSRGKAAANRKKHSGITFEKASEVFEDLFHYEEYDDENSVYEERYNAIGFVAGLSYITVSFTIRDEFIRIFSAREADAEEEEVYENGIRENIGERRSYD